MRLTLIALHAIQMAHPQVPPVAPTETTTTNGTTEYVHVAAGPDGLGIICVLPIHARAEDCECVEYVDETGQRVGVLVKKPLSAELEWTGKGGETAGTAIARLDANNILTINSRRDATPYMAIEVEPDYVPKFITVRVDGANTKMSWFEFAQAIRDRRKKLGADTKGNQ